MTGRRAGYCAGFEEPGFRNDIPGWGRGMGWGRGRGRGRGLGYGWRRDSAAPTPDFHDEPSQLRYQSESLKKQLEAVEKRLKHLEERD